MDELTEKLFGDKFFEMVMNRLIVDLQIHVANAGTQQQLIITPCLRDKNDGQKFVLQPQHCIDFTFPAGPQIVPRY